jgi:hypothetical protein
LRPETETKSTTEANLPSPLPILDQQNHTDPELHIGPMTNPDFQTENHLSRFVSPLQEHNTNNPNSSSLSVQPSESSTSRGSPDQEPRYQFRKRKRNNQEDEEDERQANLMKALIAMTTQNPDEGDIEQAMVAIPKTYRIDS